MAVEFKSFLDNGVAQFQAELSWWPLTKLPLDRRNRERSASPRRRTASTDDRLTRADKQVRVQLR